MEHKKEELYDEDLLISQRKNELKTQDAELYRIWYEKLKELSKNSVRISGCSHTLFVRNFCDAVNTIVVGLDEETKNFVLSLAEIGFGYKENPDVCRNEGCCYHGFPTDCCPLGCGEGFAEYE